MCVRLQMPSFQEIQSIYYDHYGYEELYLSRRYYSKKLLFDCLQGFGLSHDDYWFIEDREKMFDLLSGMTNYIFRNEYDDHLKSKTTKYFYRCQLGISNRFVVLNQIDRSVLRRVYSILI